MIPKKHISTICLFVGILLFGFLAEGCKENKGLPMIKLLTEFGEIVVEIDSLNAPLTVTNFLKYVDGNRYRDAAFYRVVTHENQPNDSIQIQVIQGGMGFTENPLQFPSIQHETTKETGILHKNGVLSMARNQPGTASSEFFICVGDQPELDFGGRRNPDGQGFAAFGKVVKGMEVVHKIHNQPENGQMLITPVRISNILRVNSLK